MDEYVVRPFRNFVALLLGAGFVAAIGYAGFAAFEPAVNHVAFSYEEVRSETGLTAFHMNVAER